MKNSAIIISFIFLLCFTFSCKKDVLDSEKAASVISDAFELEEGDALEIVEFSLESEEAGLAEFKLNGNRLSSRIKRTDAGWALSEIQSKEDEWIRAEYFVKIKGKLIEETEEAFADQTVTLYELINDEGTFKTTIKVGEGGILLNPSTKTDSDGNFTIIADRRFWEGSGMFTIGASSWRGEVYLRNANDIIIAVEVDENAKKVDLGVIKVKY